MLRSIRILTRLTVVSYVAYILWLVALRLVT